MDHGVMPLSENELQVAPHRVLRETFGFEAFRGQLRRRWMPAFAHPSVMPF